MPRLDRAIADVAAPPDVVFSAFVDAEALATWLPPAEMTGEVSDFDPCEGGGFTMTLTYPAGFGGQGKTTADSDVTHVEIDELIPDRRVVWGVEFHSDDPDHAGRMTMTWTFTEHDGGTRVAIDATDVPAGIDPDTHQQGLAASLANLAAYCEENA